MNNEIKENGQQSLVIIGNDEDDDNNDDDDDDYDNNNTRKLLENLIGLQNYDATELNDTILCVKPKFDFNETDQTQELNQKPITIQTDNNIFDDIPSMQSTQYLDQYTITGFIDNNALQIYQPELLNQQCCLCYCNDLILNNFAYNEKISFAGNNIHHQLHTIINIQHQ